MNQRTSEPQRPNGFKWIITIIIIFFISIITNFISHYHHHQINNDRNQNNNNPLITRSLNFNFNKANQQEPSLEPSPAILNYLKLYSSLPDSIKPLGLLLLIFWLLFLFAFVGIVASDFFCPNLSTISTRLGLSESVAGVTFLGLGNGAPDVFSTFAAMRAGTGSLALGELLGAASFIVSVVAGSMTLVRPFKVPRHAFLRDVGFFTFAIGFVVYIIHDGQIVRWEANCLIGLYCAYVMAVGLGSWYVERKRKLRDLIYKVRNQYAEDGQEVAAFRDDPDFPFQPTYNTSQPASLSTTPIGSPRPPHQSSPTLGPISLDSPIMTLHPLDTLSNDSDHEEPSYFSSHPNPQLNLPIHTRRMRAPSLSYKATPHNLISQTSQDLQESTDLNKKLRTPNHKSNHYHHHSPSLHKNVIRPSLLGAIEFRDVVNSLNRESRIIHQSFAVTRPRLSTLNGPSRPAKSDPSSTFNRRRADSHSCAFQPDHPAFQPDHPSGSRTDLIPHSTHVPGPFSPVDPNDNHQNRKISYGRRTGHRISQSAAPSSSSPSWPAWDHDPTTNFDRPQPGFPWVAISPTNDRETIEDRRIPSVIEPTPLIDQSHDPWRDDRILTGSSSSSSSQIHQSSQQPLKKLPDVVEELTSDEESIERRRKKIPSIMIIGEQGEETRIVSPQSLSTSSSRDGDDGSGTRRRRNDRIRWWYWLGKVILRVICPSLQGWKQKSYAGRWVAIVTTPGILVLTLTLPVVQYESEDLSPNTIEERDEDDEEEEGESLLMDRSIVSMVRVLEEHEERVDGPDQDLDIPSDQKIAHWLSIVQCLLGPMFSLLSLKTDPIRWYEYISVIGLSCILSSWVNRVESRRVDSKVKLVLCFLGFFIAMVWILCIVNEVVGILVTVGQVGGLSDAIIGLTVFAVGNSLGDLVANVTVARMGFPVMAMAACFGGPMLNVLLGIGLSSTYLISSQSGQPYQFESSHTLLVSGIGLLIVLMVTLVVVPLNGFLLSRSWGTFLVFAYFVVLFVNVGVEVLGTRRKAVLT